MKFKIDQKLLAKILTDVNRAIDPFSAIFVLRYLYFDVQENQVVACGSDGTFSIKKTLVKKAGALEIESFGFFIVLPNLFLNIVQKCSGMIEIEQKEQNLQIHNNYDTYEINLSLGLHEYINNFNIDFELYGSQIKLNAQNFRNAIQDVAFAAASGRDDEYILTGVNVKVENQQLILTAANSARLAQEIIPVNNDQNLFFDVTIQKSYIDNFIPSDINDDVTFYISEHKVALTIEQMIVQAGIINAPYKDISPVFRFQHNKKLKINKTVLANAIGKATVIVGDSYNKIRLEINEEQISIVSIKNEVGNSKVILKNNQFTYEGDPITITLNFKYLKEAISVFNDEIEINLAAPESIILIESKNKPNNKQIISPMRSY